MHHSCPRTRNPFRLVKDREEHDPAERQINAFMSYAQSIERSMRTELDGVWHLSHGSCYAVRTVISEMADGTVRRPAPYLCIAASLAAVHGSRSTDFLLSQPCPQGDIRTCCSSKQLDMSCCRDRLSPKPSGASPHLADATNEHHRRA